MKYHEDGKAQRLIDLFPVDGQVNVAYHKNTDIVTAWHKHENQVDYIICLKGSFKVGLHAARWGTVPPPVQWEYLSDKMFYVLKIPAGTWHGWRAQEPNSIMLYYMTKKYNVDDIQRKSEDYFCSKEEWYK